MPSPKKRAARVEAVVLDLVKEALQVARAGSDRPNLTRLQRAARAVGRWANKVERIEVRVTFKEGSNG